MDRDLDTATRAAVLEPCGRTCRGVEQVVQARDMGKQFTGLDGLLAFLTEKHIGGGGLRREGDTIYAVCDRCYCPRINPAVAPRRPTAGVRAGGWARCSRLSSGTRDFSPFLAEPRAVRSRFAP